ncbi:MAG TPA: hypothetical protein DDX84_09510, partial [Nitrospiraceae bacterium]|nr:hypothetical protein [Nitrospiraceae bacterium]
MKKRILILLMLTLCFHFLVSLPSDASTNPNLWVKTFGDNEYNVATSIQQTSEGGFILTGGTRPYGNEDWKLFVINLNPDGTILWQKTYGDDVLAYYASSIEQTIDGGYILTGGVRNSNQNDWDIMVLKLNSDGTYKWHITLGSIGYDYTFSITQTSDGGYALTGGTGSSNAVGSDVVVIKIDPDDDVNKIYGNIKWQKTYGGSDNDIAFSIQQTIDGGYILTGRTRSFNAGGRDVLVMKLDADGTPVWQKTYGGNYNDTAFSIQQTSDGGYILAGRTEFSEGGWNDVLVIKLDENGTPVWQKTYGGDYNDAAFSIQQTNDGGYILTGRTESFSANSWDILILKLDPSGNISWQKIFAENSPESGFSVQQTVDGGYIIAGETSSVGAGYKDVIILRLDPSGLISESECPFLQDINVTEGIPSFTGESSALLDGDLAFSNSGYSIGEITNSYESIPVCLATNVDVDGDGFYTPEDCNDNADWIYPGALEIPYDGIDQDCDGRDLIDVDGDGYNAVLPAECEFSDSGPADSDQCDVSQLDCNDNNASINPGATEICNGVDDDCNGQVDNTYYQDSDTDTYGNVSISTQACTQPAGYVTNSADCNDSNASINPGASESCNDIDDNCNGQIDEGVLNTYYSDADSDTYGNVSIST